MSTVDPPLNSTSQPQYPLIDSDPHFSRVVRYMRDTDYAVWTAATVGWPTLLAIWGESLPAFHLPRCTRHLRKRSQVVGYFELTVDFAFARPDG